MPAQTQGAAPGFGTYGGSSGSMTPVTFKVWDASNTEITSSGFIMPTVDGFTLTHNYETATTRKGNGDFDSHTSHGEYLELSVDLVFTADSQTNLAKVERGFPMGSKITVSGAPIRAMGSFTDAINVAETGSLPDTAPWFPMPGMSIRRSSSGTSTGSVTMRRYANIGRGAAIVT